MATRLLVDFEQATKECIGFLVREACGGESNLQLGLVAADSTFQTNLLNK